jgi:hypothetical protein
LSLDNSVSRALPRAAVDHGLREIGFGIVRPLPLAERRGQPLNRHVLILEPDHDARADHRGQRNRIPVRQPAVSEQILGLSWLC